MFPWQLCLRKPDLRTIGAAGNIIIDMGVLLSEDFNKSRPRELCRAMGKETQRSPNRLGWDNLAADALELARLIPPGPERIEALKLASLLRCTADARGLIFAKRAAEVNPAAVSLFEEACTKEVVRKPCA
jgi:hypothetical protein